MPFLTSPIRKQFIRRLNWPLNANDSFPTPKNELNHSQPLVSLLLYTPAIMESVEAFNIDGQTTGLLPVTRIKVEPGCKGFVAAVSSAKDCWRRNIDNINSLQTVNAALHQLVVVDIFNTERHYRISSMTFYGQGERVQMKNAYGQDHWSFGPLEGPAVVQISVLHRRGTGLWIPSKTVGPLTVRFLFHGMYFSSSVLLPLRLSSVRKMMYTTRRSITRLYVSQLLLTNLTNIK